MVKRYADENRSKKWLYPHRNSDSDRDNSRFDGDSDPEYDEGARCLAAKGVECRIAGCIAQADARELREQDGFFPAAAFADDQLITQP